MRPYSVEIFRPDFTMVGLPDRVEAGAEDGDLAWAVLVAVAVDDQRVLGHFCIGMSDGMNRTLGRNLL